MVRAASAGKGPTVVEPVATVTEFVWARRYDGYEVAAEWAHQTPWHNHAFRITTGGRLFAGLTENGVLYVYPGYYFDGASGPTREPEPTLCAWLAHDVLYQAMRRRCFPPHLRTEVDRWCVWKLAYRRWPGPRWLAWLRCTYYAAGLRWFGASSADPAKADEDVHRG